jgi:hypothetical protein
LYEIGIMTFDQLATQEPYTLARKLGPFLTANRICRDGWIEQARMRVQHAHTTDEVINKRGWLRIEGTDQDGNKAAEKVAGENSGVE